MLERNDVKRPSAARAEGERIEDLAARNPRLPKAEARGGIPICVGARFTLAVNGARMEIIKLEQAGRYVTVRDLKTGKTYHHAAEFIKHLQAKEVEPF